MAHHTTNTTGADVKTEPASPATSETSSIAMGYHNTSGGVPSHENGYHGTTSDDSMDTSYDAPLDFSIKRPRRHENIEERDILRDPNTEVVIPRSPDSPPPLSVPHRNGTSSADHVKSEYTGCVTTNVNGTFPDENSKDSVSDGVGGGSEPDRRGKIGEPQTALAGTLPGTVIPGLANMPGLPSGLFANPTALGTLPFMLDPRRIPQQSPNNKSNTRPFKAYPKDPLSLPLGYYGIPGMLPFPPIDAATAQAMSMTTDELFNQYRQYVNKLQNEAPTEAKKEKGENGDRAVHPNPTITPPPLPSGGPKTDQSTSDASKTIVIAPTTPTMPTSGVIPTSTPVVMPAPTLPADLPSPTPSQTSSRKRGKSHPEDRKDDAYWERRRKNNEAAKRSRDARRAKEDEIAIRAAFLEQENLKLRVEVAALKNETAKLRCMLYNS